MNFYITVLILLGVLQLTSSSTTHHHLFTDRSSIAKFNISLIPFRKGTTVLYDNTNVGDARHIKTSLSSSIKTILKPNTRWKIGRVTNKQFGIISILWQKTKVFLDQDYSDLTCKATTVKMTPDIQNQSKKKASMFSTTHIEKMQTSTPSYIEFFYYLDQGDDRIKRKHPSNVKTEKQKKNNKSNTHRSNYKKTSFPSLLEISINALRHQVTSQSTKLMNKLDHDNIYGNILSKTKGTKLSSKAPLTVKAQTKNRSSKQTQQPRKFQSQLTTNIFTKITPGKHNVRPDNKVIVSKNKLFTTPIFLNTTHDIDESYPLSGSTSIAYDKVKFFEIYDSNTPKLHNYILSNLRNNDNINEEINDRNVTRILLHHVNENIGHHPDKNKTRYVKKHIQDLYNKEVLTRNEKNISQHFNTKEDLKVTSQFQVSFQRNFSRPTTWTEFPFVAVYIYEPSQVRCDVAGITPHWLLGAASCLSRHRKGLRGGGLSAFVTFCGNSWRQPQIISYVKRTIIHPMYHPKNDIRRLFNAGLIQVVNSMADTCSGWAPASLMSHQYTADDKGSIGMAVGWGLDRYDESYTAVNIPNHALMVYESQVYSHMCPGSTEYSRVKSYDDVGVGNVYCLLLPPYLAEENDTVHGALLLIGGKLLALYLKEERRSWGVQSAQYTGIWRLLPWLMDTVREPYDSFQFEI